MRTCSCATGSEQPKPVDRDKALGRARPSLPGRARARERARPRALGRPAASRRPRRPRAISSALEDCGEGLVDLRGRPEPAELPPPRLLGRVRAAACSGGPRASDVARRSISNLVTMGGIFRPFALVNGPRRGEAGSMPRRQGSALEPFGRLAKADRGGARRARRRTSSASSARLRIRLRRMAPTTSTSPPTPPATAPSGTPTLRTGSRTGASAWASPTPWWGIWEIPEEELRILPDVTGLDVLDLGCGTGYWCAWFARLGARPVGLDLSEEQLATARELQAEHGIEFPLIHASAEAPPLPDCLVRPRLLGVRRGHLVRPVRLDSAGAPAAAAGRAADLPLHTRSSRLALRSAERGAERGELLLRPQAGLGRDRVAGPTGPTSTRPTAERITLLRETGFEIEALHELYAPDGDPDEVRYFVRRGWAQQWPCEEVWVARR